VRRPVRTVCFPDVAVAGARDRGASIRRIV
jgi:hypothetical protein